MSYNILHWSIIIVLIWFRIQFGLFVWLLEFVDITMLYLDLSWSLLHAKLVELQYFVKEIGKGIIGLGISI